jgi:Spy/CpxP family protein refolding chaperone
MEDGMLLHQRMIVASVAAVAGLMAAGATYAQTSQQAPPPVAPAAKSPTPVPPPAGPPPAGQLGGMGRGQGDLSLTQAQRDQIRTLREAQRKDSQALREKMRTARQQLREAMRADMPDEGAVRSAAGAVAALQADQAALRARARSQFMKALTPEQQAQMKRLRARAAERAQRAQRAIRAQRLQRQMIDRDRMVYRNRMMRQQYYRWWRGWI